MIAEYTCISEERDKIKFSHFRYIDKKLRIQIVATMLDTDDDKIVHKTTIHLSMEDAIDLSNKIKEIAVNQLLKIKG